MFRGVTTFAVVHGAWHGAWCWDRLIPELTAAGHRVVADDLPCEDVSAGCQEYAEVVLQRLADKPDDDEVVLVGHSAGGLTVPLVAAPTPVARTVFVSPPLPPPVTRSPHPNPRAAILLT